MAFAAGVFFAQLGVQLGLSLLQRQFNRSPNRLESQRQPSELRSRGEASYPVVNVLGEARIPGRQLYLSTETYDVTSAPYFSAARPGTGRYLHTAIAFSRGRIEGVTARWIDGKIFGPSNLTPLPDTADGGKAVRGVTDRGGNFDATSYLLADGSQGATLRKAAAQIQAQGGGMQFDSDYQGNDVAWEHLRFSQPPFGPVGGAAAVGEQVSGQPLPIVWDEDDDGPNLEFVVKGRHLRIPTAGKSFADWPVQWTSNAAAVRLWELLEWEGIRLDRLDLASFVEAFGICGRQLMVDVTDQLCNIRFAFRLTADNVAPAAITGNAWPPPSPWVARRPNTTSAMKYAWWMFQRQVDGVWQEWCCLRRYGRYVLNPDRPQGGVTEYARVTASVVQGTGSSATAWAIDTATVSISPVRTEDDPDEEPGSGEREDPTNPDDEEPNPGGVEIPPDSNPGNPDSQFCGLFDTDKTVDQYAINGVVTSDDPVESIRDEMDWQWQGTVVVHGGKLYARPGADRNPVAHIDASHEDVDVLRAETSPALSRRLNACTIKLASSRTNAFQAYTMPRLVDTAQAAEDGKIINRNLGTRPFETSPTAARTHQRKALAAARPVRTYTVRVPIEWDRALWTAIPGDRVTFLDPERGLNAILLRDQRSPLFAYGDHRGRFFRIVGKRFDFQSFTIDLSIAEHPNGTYDGPEIPPLLPDPSIPGVYVGQPTGLGLAEDVYVARDGTERSRIVGTSNLAAVARRVVQWRPVIPGGVSPNTYDSLTTKDGEGNDVTLTETPDWGADRQLTTDGADFSIEDVRVHVTYEVRLIDRSAAGVDSEPSATASITLVGTTGWTTVLMPPDPTDVSSSVRFVGQPSQNTYGTSLVVDFDAVDGADGYRLLYVPAVGAVDEDTTLLRQRSADLTEAQRAAGGGFNVELILQDGGGEYVHEWTFLLHSLLNGTVTGPSAVVVEVVAPPTAPPVPTGLGATVAGSTITVSWNASAGATGYRLQRSTDGVSFSTIVQQQTGTSYADSGLADGTYYYEVASINGGILSDYSGSTGPHTVDTAVPLPVPATPTGLTASADGTNVTISWNASANATAYRLQRGLGTQGPWQTAAIGAGTTVVDFGLADNDYYYQVRASNLSGSSAYSAPFGPVTVVIPNIAPGTPTSFSADCTQDGAGADVICNTTWNQGGGGNPTRYRVERFGGVEWEAVGTTFGTSLRFTVDAPPGHIATTATLRVRAENFQGDSAWRSDTFDVTQGAEL